jgi:hypothetical protein
MTDTLRHVAILGSARLPFARSAGDSCAGTIT